MGCVLLISTLLYLGAETVKEEPTTFTSLTQVISWAFIFILLHINRNNCPNVISVFQPIFANTENHWFLISIFPRISIFLRPFYFLLESRKWQTDLKPEGRQPEPRSFHACVSVGSRIIVTGGRGSSDQHFQDFHVFDTGMYCGAIFRIPYLCYWCGVGHDLKEDVCSPQGHVDMPNHVSSVQVAKVNQAEHHPRVCTEMSSNISKVPTINGKRKFL